MVDCGREREIVRMREQDVAAVNFTSVCAENTHVRKRVWQRQRKRLCLSDAVTCVCERENTYESERQWVNM